MRISNLEITNFRTLKEFKLEIDQYTVIVGKNNSGKSNLLKVIEIFYQPKLLDVEDFTKDEQNQRISDEMKIEITFSNLTENEKKKNNKYLIEDKIKIAYIAKISEEKSKGEHHGYIQSYSLNYPLDFDETNPHLKDILNNSSPPLKSNIDNAELLEIVNRIQSSGRISSDSWIIIKDEFLNLHPEIERISSKVLSTDKYHGFIKTTDPESIGKCISIPAIQNPVNNMDSTKSNSPINQLIDFFIGEIYDTPLVQENFQRLKESLVNESNHRKQELEEKFNQELENWKTKIEIKIPPIEIKNLRPSGTIVEYNDGISTTIDKKGTGLQRYIFFKFLKIYNEMNLSDKNSLILLFEEPEAHLHPQFQREISYILHQLNENSNLNIQIIISTHSPQFIDFDHLNSIIIMKKDESHYSQSRDCKILFDDLKEEIKTSLFFDANIKEIFFSERIILVEGQSEEIAVNYFIQKGLLDVSKVSIINVKSKSNFKTFLNVINNMNIPYYLLCDEDPYSIPNSKMNEEIANLVIERLGKLIFFKPDFDSFLGTTRSQINRNGKPTATYERLTKIEKENHKDFLKIKTLFQNIIEKDVFIHKLNNVDGTEWILIDESNVTISEITSDDLEDRVELGNLTESEIPKLNKTIKIKKKSIKKTMKKKKQGLNGFMEKPEP